MPLIMHPTGKKVERDEYHKLKCEVEVLKKRLDSASSREVKESAVTLIKDQLQQFIESSLKAGLDDEKVKSEIKNLCQREFAVPTILWEWVNEEFEEKYQKHVKQSQSNANACARLSSQDQDPSLFCKDTVYHASLCCEAVSSCVRSSDIDTFFQRKNPRHNMKAISLSKDDNVKTYLIAKQGNTIYVAFKSEALLAKWKETGFDEGWSGIYT